MKNAKLNKPHANQIRIERKNAEKSQYFQVADGGREFRKKTMRRKGLRLYLLYYAQKRRNGNAINVGADTRIGMQEANNYTNRRTRGSGHGKKKRLEEK